ncbi:hypothetical protein [Sulfitobacter sediminilitoris]|uniref:GltB/FmdC/FwdC-like GXGXG domain-containing protein n=1 Tax=Sulfitobacter sediminilitoris TaxID=2698830 RepID=UPI003617F31A
MSEIVIEVGKRHIREINEEIQEACKTGQPIRVVNTLSRHNLGVGLPDNVDITFEGSVGYYCGGLNTGANIKIERNSGWATGEGMAKGHIEVGGRAGMSCGAAMIGGTIHVKGDAGPRCGVAMKGGNIVVEGTIGYQSGFMAHAGKIIALGGAGNPVLTRCGRARSGSRGRSKVWVWMSTSWNPRQRKSLKWTRFLNRWALSTARATGAR